MSRASNVNRSKFHEKMVQRLCVEKLPELGKSLFPTIREFLSFAALLGYSEGRKIQLDRDDGVEDIAGAQYEHHEAIEILWAIAIAELTSSDILREGNEADCAEIYEEYANGGMTMVSEWLEAAPDQPADRAIFAGLKNAGYLIQEQDENLDDAISSIEF